MDFASQIGVATDPAFVLRVQQAAVKVALAVAAESDNVAHHADRARLSYQVLHNAQQYGRSMAYGVVANPSITIESSDADIEFAVSAVWNAYARAG